MTNYEKIFGEVEPEIRDLSLVEINNRLHSLEYQDVANKIMSAKQYNHWREDSIKRFC